MPPSSPQFSHYIQKCVSSDASLRMRKFQGYICIFGKFVDQWVKLQLAISTFCCCYFRCPGVSFHFFLWCSYYWMYRTHSSYQDGYLNFSAWFVKNLLFGQKERKLRNMRHFVENKMEVMWHCLKMQ
jgi:hypothetical protein